MRDKKREKYILTFFLLALFLVFVGYGPSFFASYGLLNWPPYLFLLFVAVGAGSPTIAALIVAYWEEGKGGIRSLFKQFDPRGVYWTWFVVSILFPLLIAAITVGVWVARGMPYRLDPTSLILFLPFLASNFAFNVWEEIGWRGYALPKLQKIVPALVASLIIGAVWALWHWPLFFAVNSQLAVNFHYDFALLASFTVFVSIIYTWLYNSSNSNLLTVSLFHASINSANAVLFVFPGVSFDISFTYVLVVVLISLLIAFFFNPYQLSWHQK